MTGLVLLALAAVIATSAPALLVRARWVYRSPRLGIAAWHSVLAAVVAALALGGASLFLPWSQTRDAVCTLWRVCVAALGGGHGGPGRVMAGAGLLLAAAVLARLSVTAVRVARSTLRQRRSHVEILSLIGRQAPELGVTVVTHPHPAAYLVRGRPATIVVTTGALECLTRDEVAAVLAHERAHETGRHHVLLDAACLLEHAFPRVALFGCARAQLARLVEMRADDVATERHSRVDLARAMVAMATNAAPTNAAPAGALAAAGGDAVERLNRLLTPPAPLTRRVEIAVLVGLAALPLLPPTAVLLAGTTPLLSFCTQLLA